jgi:hypothetical protein
MKNEKIIRELCLEITAIHFKILECFPTDDDQRLKHLGASSIHLARFVENFVFTIPDEKIKLKKELENEFLKGCGCSLYEKNSIN